MKRKMVFLLSFLFGLSLVAGETELKIDYDKYVLDNGLEVILHKDTSDPIVAVAIIYHVGSNREEKGRTGFAHLFEHMLFQESQHVGQDQLFKKIQDAGGTLNGGTWQDGTVYFEVVPKNALEMVLWLESDRMGFLLSTVTQEAFTNQQSVVVNEKRQRVDNRPYGHTNYVLQKMLYPEDHPYNWQVIGSMDDLFNATLADVRDFYKKWYGPNNATLVIAGDYQADDTKKLVEKYFGEIKKGQEVSPPKPWPVELTETKHAYHEDNFASSPELNMLYPTIKEFTKDAYALDILSNLLADGKKAPLYKVIVEQEKLAPSVMARQNSSEITGEFHLRIRAFPDKNLGDVEKAVFKAYELFETEKFTEKDLARIKAKTERDFYEGIASVLNKAFQLSSYNEYAGTPDFITEDIQNSLDVTTDDVWRVYNKYIKDQHYVATNFVPKGKTELIVEGSEKFPVVEEEIKPQEEADKTAVAESAEIEPIPTSFDRTVEPKKGPVPELNIPTVWKHQYKNGLKIYGIEHNELPLIEFSLSLKGGMLLDDIDKIGVANLMTDIMMEGTKNKTPVELEEAIEGLGSSINMYTNNEAIVVNGSSLSEKAKPTYTLFEEILLEPRWDEKEFARVKDRTIENINRRATQPTVIAEQVFDKLLYGDDHILAHSTLGTEASVKEITIDDLKAYYKENFSPSVAYITIAGNISKKNAVALFQPLADKWQAKEVTYPEYELSEPAKEPKLYFVDVPDAKQSEIRIGYLALAQTHPDYYPAYVMNYKLGGSFNGIVNLILREEKGFTYGARTGFSGSLHPGPFAASSAVQSNATFESMQIFKDELAKYSEGISDEDLQFTKNALVLSNARRFETLGALRGMLESIAKYGFDNDYVKQREAFVKSLTVEQHQKLAKKYLDTGKFVYLVVGDAATQLEPLKELGLGDPILLDRNGDPAEKGISTKSE